MRARIVLAPDRSNGRSRTRNVREVVLQATRPAEPASSSACVRKTGERLASEWAPDQSESNARARAAPQNSRPFVCVCVCVECACTNTIYTHTNTCTSIRVSVCGDSVTKRATRNAYASLWSSGATSMCGVRVCMSDCERVCASVC